MARWGILPRAALIALSIAILIISNSTGDYNHADWSDIGFPPTIACWLWATTWSVFRAPERALPPTLRLRARIRRVFYRSCVSLLTTSLFMLTLDAVFTLKADNVPLPDGPQSAIDAAEAAVDRWTAWAHTAAGWAQVAALIAVMVPFLDPLAWWLWIRLQPEEIGAALRQHLIDDRAVKAIADMARPERNNPLTIGTAVGSKARSGGTGSLGRTVRIRPRKDGISERSAARTPWFTDGYLAWDGTQLLASGGRGAPLAWPVAAGGVDADFTAEAVGRVRQRPGESGAAVTTVVEIAAVTTTRALFSSRWAWKGGDQVMALLLLDARSRRLASLPFAGLHAAAVAELAEAAGIGFRTYLGFFASAELGETLKAYFPKSIHYRRVRGPRTQTTDWLPPTPQAKRKKKP